MCKGVGAFPVWGFGFWAQGSGFHGLFRVVATKRIVKGMQKGTIRVTNTRKVSIRFTETCTNGYLMLG